MNTLKLYKLKKYINFYKISKYDIIKKNIIKNIIQYK